MIRQVHASGISAKPHPRLLQLWLRQARGKAHLAYELLDDCLGPVQVAITDAAPLTCAAGLSSPITCHVMLAGQGGKAVGCSVKRLTPL